MIEVRLPEETYFMPHFGERLQEDYKEICYKISIIDNEYTYGFAVMNDKELNLLKKQRKAMAEYRNALEKRMIYYGVRKEVST